MKILLIVISMLITGCTSYSTKWTTETAINTNSGEKPVHYKKSIDEYLSNTLKDPFSVKLKNMSEPKIDTYQSRVVLQKPTPLNNTGRDLVTTHHRWTVTINVNAKNSYGAYSGWKLYRFTFHNEKISLSGTE